MITPEAVRLLNCRSAAREQSETRLDGRLHVVDPDSRVHGTSYTDQVYDVKTCGHRVHNKSTTSSCNYGVSCPKKTPVQLADVVLGRSPRPESSEGPQGGRRAKATRLAAVHVASESIPADRGNFGA